jgi:hypothetical protein
VLLNPAKWRIIGWQFRRKRLAFARRHISGVHSRVHSKYLIGWLVAVQGPNDPKPRLYAAVAEQKAYPSLEHETGHAEALVGDLLVTNERVEFQRRLTNGEIARLRLKPGEVKRFE